MGRGHSGKSDSELSTIRRLKLENQKLKKQMSKLRKQLSRIDIDRYSNLRDIIEAHALEDEGFDAKLQLEQLKEVWLCHTCKKDYLRIIMIPRADGTFYIRKCPACDHRTKMKKFTDDIGGIDSNGDLLEV